MNRIPGTATDPESLGLSEWPSIEPLLDKAINSPSTITQEEKHKIAEWIPSREEMEARTQKYLNRSLEELFETAATNKNALTYPDCLMIAQGFHLLGQLDHVGRDNAIMHRSNVYPELQAKWELAKAAVLSEVELQAVKNASNAGFLLEKQEPYFEQQDRELAEARTRPPPWIQKIIDGGNDMSWGYVIYCYLLDDSQDWNSFRSNFHCQIDDLPMLTLGADTIRDKKVAELYNFDGAEEDFDGLRKNFRALREQEGLKPGVLPQVFLYVSTECRESWLGALFPWLWAIDPDWPLDGPDEDGYDGKVALSWSMAFVKFYDFMSMGRFTLKEIWRDLNETRQRAPDPEILRFHVYGQVHIKGNMERFE